MMMTDSVHGEKGKKMKLYTADAIKEQVHKLICQDCEESDVCSICDYRELIDKILDAPTIDAESIRHGHWEWHGCTYDMPWRCSECSEFNEHDSYYCPNCGAKMDEK